MRDGSQDPPPRPEDDYTAVGTAKWIIKVAIDIVVFLVIAFAPAIPYLKQYAIIKARRDVGAFSVYVCAIMLYGQAFRILFW